jgi:hypothetical protein
MAFPFETEDETAVEETVKIPREYGIDFATGELTGKIVEGNEAIKVWMWNTIHTPRYRYNIFSWDYGDEIEDLIGQGYSQEYIEIEAKRMVEDCLLLNENITGIDDFEVSQENDKLSVSFIASTLFGEVDMSV